MQAAVNMGRDIGTAMERTDAFPPVVVQIFTVGKETGRLEEMLDWLAESCERQVASMSARLAAAREPILIVLLAIFVGFILFATIVANPGDCQSAVRESRIKSREPNRDAEATEADGFKAAEVANQFTPLSAPDA